MRELERPSEPSVRPTPPRVAVVGDGRLGNALARALDAAGASVRGPLHRGAAPAGFDAVLLCVPDGEIAAAAANVPAEEWVGHCSGASGLEVLGRARAFSLHPLMTVPGAGEPTTDFSGVTAAIDGASTAGLSIARELALMLGMRPIELSSQDRVAYHAAASIASNFLVVLEAAAERLAASAGLERDHLVPLVRATVENWARLGPERALTGPVARGDTETVARQRAAVAERVPELLAMFDALVDATAALARPVGAGR